MYKVHSVKFILQKYWYFKNESDNNFYCEPCFFFRINKQLFYLQVIMDCDDRKMPILTNQKVKHLWALTDDMQNAPEPADVGYPFTDNEIEDIVQQVINSQRIRLTLKRPNPI